MFFRFIAYLNFLRCSTNQHDLHSPFVYDFVTKCLYHSPKIAKNKAQSVAVKCVDFFKCVSIYSENKFIKNEENQNNQSENSNFDLAYLENPDNSKVRRLLSGKKLDNDSIVIIKNIYEDKGKHREWKSIAEMSEITISIDLFYCGVLFFRSEQVKEHFTIRI